MQQDPGAATSNRRISSATSSSSADCRTAAVWLASPYCTTTLSESWPSGSRCGASTLSQPSIMSGVKSEQSSASSSDSPIQSRTSENSAGSAP